ncbi:MAG: hypothetical protein II007_13475 [Gammaproteobacteria bacterium]|nr:hypothetical protein [Gammaproteobacteria bacterium]
MTMKDMAGMVFGSLVVTERAAMLNQHATELRWLVNRLREARANDRDPAMQVQVVTHAAA